MARFLSEIRCGPPPLPFLVQNHPHLEIPDVRLLITGGAGFIGSQYVRTVLTGGYPAFAGARVTVLDRLTYAGNLANLAPVEGGYDFVHGDVCDAALLREVVPGH